MEKLFKIWLRAGFPTHSFWTDTKDCGEIWKISLAHLLGKAVTTQAQAEEAKVKQP